VCSSDLSLKKTDVEKNNVKKSKKQ
jgi:hypothetical protein